MFQNRSCKQRVGYLGDGGRCAPADATVGDLDGHVIAVDQRPGAQHAACLETCVERADVRITVDHTQTPHIATTDRLTDLLPRR